MAKKKEFYCPLCEKEFDIFEVHSYSCSSTSHNDNYHYVCHGCVIKLVRAALNKAHENQPILIGQFRWLPQEFMGKRLQEPIPD